MAKTIPKPSAVLVSVSVADPGTLIVVVEVIVLVVPEVTVLVVPVVIKPVIVKVTGTGGGAIAMIAEWLLVYP